MGLRGPEEDGLVLGPLRPVSEEFERNVNGHLQLVNVIGHHGSLTNGLRPNPDGRTPSIRDLVPEQPAPDS